MHERSDSYKRIKDRVVKEYQTEPTQLWAKHWFEKVAPKWRNRVGIPRLTAQEVAAEVDGLLRSVSATTFRSEPELRALLLVAREASREFYYALARSNWDRFEGGSDE